MSKNFFFVLLVCQALLIALTGKSQIIEKLPFEKKIGTDKGLSSYNANKIIQDKFGFIWIATQDGLNRYNGNEFIIYNKSTSRNHLLLGNVINDIIEDTIKNILWVTTSYGGLNGIDLETGNVVRSLKYTITDSGFHNGWLRSINICNGRIWIGSDDGLTVYDPLNYRFVKTDPLPFKKNNERSRYSINTIFTDQHNHVWVYMPDFGIVIYSGITNKVLRYYTCNELNIHDTQGFWEFPCRLAKINSLTCILGTDHGFRILEYDSLGDVHLDSKIFFLNNYFGNDQITSCAMSSDGSLWFSTPGHLYKYQFGNHHYEIINDIAKQELTDWLDFISYIFFDGQNNIWIGAQKGVVFCRNSQSSFIPYFQSKNTSVRINHANYVYPLNDSVIYVCSETGFYEINVFSEIFLKVANPIRYNYVFKNIDNNIIASADNGLFAYRSGNMVSVGKFYPELISIENEDINSAVILGDTLVIMGSETSKGVYLWNFKRHTLQNLRMTNGDIENPIINTVYKDSHNKVWVLFDNAFAILDVKKNNYYKRFQIEDPELRAPLNIFFDICEMNNNYWLAVYGKGVVELDSNYKIKKIYTTKDGLSNTGVYKVLPYQDSLLFVTSNNGLFSINIKTEKIHQYLKEDGLNTNNFEESCGYINGNTFYVGGENGFTIVKPQYLQNNTMRPVLFIDQFNIKTTDKVVDTFNLYFEKFSISADALQTNISFSALNYSNPSRTTFAYRIKELNNNWISLGTQNFVNLIGLSPGTYTLEVKAANEDGVWSEPKTLSLTFLPKWYQTAWFKAAVVLAIGGLFYIFYRYRINQLKKQQQIRRDIASDLHDDLGATLSSVRIFTGLAEASPKREEYFQQIKESVNIAYSGLRDMIWVLDDTGDTIADLVKRIKQFADPLAQANDIHLRFSADSINETTLNKTEKRNLLLIAKEAINNCMKYAECKNIQISFSKSDGKLAMIMRDDGRGFNEKEITPGNGLKNIRARAKQIHYTASIESTKGEGATITVVKK